MVRRDKKPKKEHPVRISKKPHTPVLRDGHIQWSFAIFDKTPWSDGDDHRAPFVEVAALLRDYESMPWASFDRKRDHPVGVVDLERPARDRLRAIKQDDTDVPWRFRFSGTRRLWGIRVGDVFRVLWWDPDHVVCKSHKKHT